MSAESQPEPFTLRDFIVAAGINLLWGLNIIAVKLSVELVPPFTAAAVRMALVAMICAPMLRIVPGRMRLVIGFGALMGGAFLALVNLSLFVSENVSALAIAGQLGTPFALILGIVFLGERIGIPRLAGIVLALAGVVILVFDPAAGRELLGIGITAIGSLAWAIGSLIQRRLAGIGIRTLYAWMGLVGTCFLLPFSLAFEPGALAALPQTPPLAFVWIGFSALGSTLLGYGGMAWLLRRHEVSTVVPLMLASPVISVVAASLAFGTPLTPLMILGGILAMSGVAVISIRSVRRPRPPVAV